MSPISLDNCIYRNNKLDKSFSELNSFTYTKNTSPLNYRDQSVIPYRAIQPPLKAGNLMKRLASEIEPFSLSKGFSFATLKAELESVVVFLHSKLPFVPIKVIRANTMDSESNVIQLVLDGQLIAAVVYKDHTDREFREVKYFCTAYAGYGYGTLLMNELKRQAAFSSLYFIVLYASNTATQFFEKQRFYLVESVRGLSKYVILPRVEQYQRSTLMVADLVDELSLKTKGDWRVGQLITVECGWKRKQLEDAVIRKVSDCGSKIFVHFKKWSASFDEWIVATASRLNPRPS